MLSINKEKVLNKLVLPLSLSVVLGLGQIADSVATLVSKNKIPISLTSKNNINNLELKKLINFFSNSELLNIKNNINSKELTSALNIIFPNSINKNYDNIYNINLKIVLKPGVSKSIINSGTIDYIIKFLEKKLQNI